MRDWNGYYRRGYADGKAETIPKPGTQHLPNRRAYEQGYYHGKLDRVN